MVLLQVLGKLAPMLPLVSMRFGWAQDLSCNNFSADMISKNTNNIGEISLVEFTCEGESAYLTSMDLKWGWWIDALQVACSDGSASEWFGNVSYDGPNGTATFGGGLTNLSAYILDLYEVSHPTIITLFGYDEGKGYPNGMTLGPYGEEQERLIGNYSENPETSACGPGSYAIGVSVYESQSFVHGMQLHCQQVNSSSCPAPEGLLVSGSNVVPTFSSMSPSAMPNTAAPTLLEPENAAQPCSEQSPVDAIAFSYTARFRDQYLSCNNFPAEIIWSATVDVTYLVDFMCEGNDSYISGMDILWGWWIDALKFACSDGSESEWFGNELNNVSHSTASFGGGLSNISAYILDQNESSYPTLVTVYGYDEFEGYPDGRMLGPYGEEQEHLAESYSEQPQTSDCGVGGYAIGVSVNESQRFIHGIQLHCQQIFTSACPALEGLLVPAAEAVSTSSPTSSPASIFSNDSVWCKPDIIRNTRQDQNSTCYNFSADMISKNITGDTLSLNRFMCEGDSAYLARMDIKFGWWIDALLFACSDGNESIWFGNGDYDGLEDTADFGAGLTSISANTLDSDDGSSYPTILTLYGYDEDEGYPDGMILGPYGEKQDSQIDNYSEEPQISDCGDGGYAIGVSIYENTSFVHGIQLHCRQINSNSCPAPEGLLVSTVGAIPTPTPSISSAPPDTLIPVETRAPTRETEPSIEPIEYNGTRAATMGSDGSVVSARANLVDGASSVFTWSATKFSLSVNKTWLYPLWEWEATTSTSTSYEWFVAEVAMGQNGGVAMIGGNDSHQAVIKLDTDGNLEWRYEAESCGSDAVAVMDDGSVVVSGRAIVEDTQAFSFASCKLYAKGKLAWRWQTGTAGEDSFNAAALAPNNSVVLAGYTYGNWNGNVGGGDFAAVKLDSEGNELWRWQEGSAEFDSFLGATTADNGSVVLVGVTYGNWSGTNQGGGDFAAVKLDADGFVSWRWQDGTGGEDFLVGAAVDEHGGTVFLGGSTTGGWGNRQVGEGYDFAGVQLDLANSNEIRRWQNGTSKDDVVVGVSGGFDGLVLLAGRTNGSWSEENLDEDQSVMIMVDISPQLALHTPSPSTNSPKPQDSASSRTSGSGEMSTLQIATITVASVVAGGALVAVLSFLLRRKIRQSKVGSSAIDFADETSNLGSSGSAARERTGIQLPSYEDVMRNRGN